MTVPAWILLGIMVAVTSATGVGLWWSWKNGQFGAEAEEVKYRMLQDE